MDITIKIEAPALVDAINALAAALAGNIELLLMGPGSRSGEVHPDIQEQRESKPQPKPEPKPESEPSNTPETATTPAENATVTLEQVRAKLAALTQSGKQPQVKELLAKFGAKRLTEVPTEKYAELLKEAEAIE